MFCIFYIVRKPAICYIIRTDLVFRFNYFWNILILELDHRGRVCDARLWLRSGGIPYIFKACEKKSLCGIGPPIWHHRVESLSETELNIFVAPVMVTKNKFSSYFGNSYDRRKQSIEAIGEYFK